MKGNPVITISREHGTAGRQVGKRLAEMLGISYYDNYTMAELFEENSEKGKEYFRNSGETEASEKQYGQFNYRYSRYKTLNEEMFDEQSRVMRGLAEKGPAVFVGRCADVVLEDHPGLITVFIGGNLEKRIRAIAERTGKDARQARAEIHARDKSRATYYSYYAERKWGLRENYDLCIDSGNLDVDGMAEVIKSFVELKK